MNKVAAKCYRPMLSLLSSLICHEPEFYLNLSVTGVAIEQMQKYCPDVIESLRQLAVSGRVEFLSETYYHSLSSLYSPTEFVSQVWRHRNLMVDLFNQTPKVFRNTELIYTNNVARQVMNMGYRGMLVEGADKILHGQRPTGPYRSPSGLPLLLKHYQLSDDIAFRFSQSARSSHPLTAETYCHWIQSAFSENELINLFMDFETFGEHQWADTGIFDFFNHFVHKFLKSGGFFVTVSKALEESSVGIYDSEMPVSWADVDRDITAWSGNQLQIDSLRKIYELENKVVGGDDEKLLADWRNLQTSDHFYYMCTKWASDGDVHAYFSPYKTPYQAYVNFAHALADINLRVREVSYG